ncbi:DUF2835 domain-containing protein [Photobacterium sp. DNB23_23_1]
MKAYTFSMHITYQQFLQHYSGAASHVLVMTENGLRLQLPAARLRPFLTQLGIRGRFRVMVSEANKLQAIEQIS